MIPFNGRLAMGCLKAKNEINISFLAECTHCFVSINVKHYFVTLSFTIKKHTNILKYLLRMLI